MSEIDFKKLAQADFAIVVPKKGKVKIIKSRYCRPDKINFSGEEGKVYMFKEIKE